MPRTQRQTVIFLVWIIFAVTALWLLVPRPSPDDDEYWRWFLVAALTEGVPWLINLIVILLLALSFEKRWGRARRWILLVWLLAACSVLAEFIEAGFVVDSNWRSSISVALATFAFPWLFALLVVLGLAIWIEAKIGKIKEESAAGAAL